MMTHEYDLALFPGVGDDDSRGLPPSRFFPGFENLLA